MTTRQIFINCNFVFLQIILLILLSVSFINAASQDVDTNFNAFPSRNSNFTTRMINQPDGKLLVYGSLSVINGVAAKPLVRLNNDGSFDNTFNCIECESYVGFSVLLQPDGKIIIAGSDNNVGPRLIRINSDGSLDSSFTNSLTSMQPQYATHYLVYSIQSDGKIFVSRFSYNRGVGINKVFRLNSDGSMDDGFNSFSTTQTYYNDGYISGIFPLSSGKLYVYGITNFGAITRLNADGTEDETFEKPVFTADEYPHIPSVRDIVVQQDGKLVIVGLFRTVNGLAYRNFARLNLDGSVDLTMTASDKNLTYPIEQFQNGQLLVLNKISILSNVIMAKLNADGTDDTSLTLPENLVRVFNFTLSNSDKIYIYGKFSENESSVDKLARLNSDGSLDTSFSVVVADNGVVNGLEVQSDQKVVMVGDFNQVNGIDRQTIGRVNADGSLDSSFNAGSGFDFSPNDVVVDSNGKLLVYGDFNTYNGNTISKLVRLEPNGSLDSGFTPEITGTILTLSLQSNGKILVGGSLLNIQGQSTPGIVRLNPDGSLDSSFNPVFGSVSYIKSIFVQPDNKIMVGGSFNGVSGFNRSNLVRLNQDGSLDNSFNASAFGVIQVEKTSTGKYLVASDSELTRLNSDGTVDNSFLSHSFIGSSGDENVNKFLILPDENIIVFGNFIKVDGNFKRGILALFSDGKLAGATYSEGTDGPIYDATIQSDGKIVLGGDFTLIENVFRSSLARLSVPEFTTFTNFDFDGDGKADVAVFRPSENRWYVLRSSDLQVSETVFAVPGDSPVPADFDGDNIADISIFRNSSGDWWSLRSSSGAQSFAHFGQDGDIPLPADFDGDGRADYIYYRPSERNWYRASSANGQRSDRTFGAVGDKPVIGDFDGDGKSDVAIFRPSDGNWWYQSSVDNSQRATRWGISTDIPIPADYDGDGKTDQAVYRPSEGGWYIFNSSTGIATTMAFGVATDIPIPADYDGDGKADIAVFRPSTGIWYILQSRDGFAGLQFGVATDIPIPSAFQQR